MRIRSVAATGALILTGLLATSGIAGAETGETDARLEVRRVPASSSAVSGSAVSGSVDYDYCWHYYVGGVERGRGCWEPYGDQMLARDTYADGYWIKVDWATDYGRDGKLADGSSKGDGNYHDYNMDEDGRITLQVELWDENHQVRASDWSPYLPIGQ